MGSGKQDFGLPVADEAATVADIGAQAFAMTPAEGTAWVEKVGLSNFRVLREAGTVVGVAGLSERARGLRVVATKPSLLCLVAFGAFEGVVRRNPEVGLRLVRVLGERIGVLEEEPHVVEGSAVDRRFL